MKKTLLIALVLTLSAGLAVAQQRGGPPGPAPGHNGMGGNPTGQVERLTEQLGLSEEQAAELAGIFEEAQLLRDEERERARLSAEENRAAVHARIQQMLTPEQQLLFEEQLQKREQLRQDLEDLRGERGFGSGRGPGDCINN
jgi:Spy/CpxP family protein refolding chaperone